MSDQSDIIITLLKRFDLSTEEVNLYLFLLQNGFCSALAISRHLHLARTKVYRLTDRLIERQLIETRFGGRGFEFGATSPDTLRKIVLKKEVEAQTLKQSLPNVISYLEKLIPKSSNNSKVLYYKGKEGLEQVTYNIIHADKLLRVFEVEHMSDFLDPKFSEKIRQELVDRNIFTRDLTNKQSFPGFTDVKEMIASYNEFRFVDPGILTIKFETLIYNNVYVTYTYKEDEIFCVEIYNEELATMQKQLFDLVWSQAKKMKFTDDRGGAKLDISSGKLL